MSIPTTSKKIAKLRMEAMAREPAFPCAYKDFQPDTGNEVTREQYFGVTIRDWFAGKALAGIAVSSENDDPRTLQWDSVAEAAYRAADAMLAERAKKCAP